MRCEEYLRIATLASLLTLAMSRAQIDIPKFDLLDVAQRAVCPIKVVIMDNPNRIPRRIKYIMCEDDPAKQCPLADVPQTCCHYRHNQLDYTMKCVEVYDSVEVKYKDSINATESIVKVAVGCVCMVQTDKKATEV